MNKYVLIVDCGNTNTSIGVFKENKLYSRIDIPSSIDAINGSLSRMLNFKKKLLLNDEELTGGLISSVVPSLNKAIITLLKEAFGKSIPIMDNTYFFDIKMDVNNPDEVGGDLLADAIAGKKLFDAPTLIIDLGTITKLIVLDKNKKFIGTSFFPGVETCLKSMKEKTALLPEISLNKRPKKFLGNNTVDAMQSGLYYGTLGLIKYSSIMVDDMFEGKVNKILTGGNSILFKNDANEFIIDENLVLKGIYLIYLDNIGK